MIKARERSDLNAARECRASSRKLNRIGAIIATLTLLAAAEQAFAASGLQLRGIADAAVGHFQLAGSSRRLGVESGQMSTSFLGFKGTEDLGDGLAAEFVLDSFVRTDIGSYGRFDGDPFFARDAYVGLRSGWGAVRLGRQTTPLFFSTIAFNAFGDSFGLSPAVRQLFIPSPTSLPFFGDTVWNNAVGYLGPSEGPLIIRLLTNAGEGAADAHGPNAAASVTYESKKFSGTIGYQSARNGVAAAPAGFSRQNAYQVGASYDFGIAKTYVLATLVQTRAEMNVSGRLYSAGFSIPFGQGKVLAQYGHAKSQLVDRDVVNQTVTVGYDHSMSKQTDIYAAYMLDRLSGMHDGNTWVGGIRVKF